MQGFFENAMTLTAVGNSFLRGQDVSGFWPNAPTFRFMKVCDFREPTPSGKGEFPLVATDPNAWFAGLKASGCAGLRLHHANRPREANQQVDAPDRMLVGFVGGGPRWLIEAMGRDRSEVWEGFQRLLDRNDPQQKIWGCTYLRVGDAARGELTPITLASAVAELQNVLPEIEAYANENRAENFGQCFADARTALNDHSTPPAGDRWNGISPERQHIRTAIDHAWVFGGMGSWNDIGGSGERYDTLSERLFTALNNAICGLANSTAGSL